MENLEYDYAKVTMGKSQPPPRIRARGEYYIDSFNGEPWTCSFGTGEEVCVFLNVFHSSCYPNAFVYYIASTQLSLLIFAIFFAEWNLDEFR